ncbi:hypothetical protein Tco_0953515 [Tanacetum coccineum]|uniref:Uncharacterized protein n=1 Tax=Tanacetum coccineum TaxID=301880 RepID=A0ABQ5E092_9ASTR
MAFVPKHNQANHNKVYALEHNPTIYVSVIKQFWQTVTVITLDNGEQELKAIIDTDEYTISESSVRNKLKLADENAYCMKWHMKVKKLENILKRRNVVLTTLEDEELEDQGRIFKEIDNDPLRSKSVDKGKRYKRRKEIKGKDFEYISTGFKEANTSGLVNTGGLGFSTCSGPVSSDRGHKEERSNDC